MVKKLLISIIYKIDRKDSNIQYITRSQSSYGCLFIGLFGIFCCLNNVLIPSVFSLIIVFFFMNIRMIIYYETYKRYASNNHYKIEEYGSKYSFSNPRVLDVKKIS